MTQNQDKTSEQLSSEVMDLRRQVAQLQAADTDHRESEEIERRRLEKTCKQTEEKLQAILTDIEGGYYEVDLAGNLSFCNDATCAIFGYSREELLGIFGRVPVVAF